MYHFTHLHLNQFRGFRNVNFNNLGRVNLLIGMNNIGKTSVLEAISLLCSSFDSMEWLAIASRRGMISPFAPPVIEALKWLFPQYQKDGDNEIIIETQGNFELRELRATFEELIATAVSTAIIQGAEIQVKRKLQLDQLISDNYTFNLWDDKKIIRAKNSIIKHTLPVSTVMPFSHRLEVIQIKQLTQAKIKGTIDYVLHLLKRIDPKIESLEILSNKGTHASLYIQHMEVGLAPLNIFGEGLQRILAIALSLSNVQNGVLLIDELEAGIHSSALKAVFSWLVEACRDYEVQLFATTHSLEALDAMLATIKEDSDEIVAYRLLNKVGDGSLKRFSGNLLYRLRYERGLDVR